MDSAVSPLRPLSVSDLIDETFQLYRRHFVLFVSISALLLIPLGIIQLLEQIAIQRQDTTSGLIGVGLMSLVVSLLRALAQLGMLSAIIYAASELRMGRLPTVTASYTNGMDHFGSMLRVGILFIVLVPLMIITIIGIPVAIYFVIAWLLSLHVAVIEDEGAFASLSRSRALVKGHWWRVLGITLLVSFLVSIVQIIFALPAAAVGVPVLLGQSHSISTGAQAISTLFSTAGSIVTGPIIYIAWLLLYYDLRARKEGYDLEVLANQADAQARSAPLQP